MNSRRCSCKKPWSNTIIRWLLQGFWLHTQREDGANTSRLQPPQRNCHSQNDAIQKQKVKICSPYGDTDYFEIVAGVLQGDALAPYLFIICLHYVLRTSIDLMKENGYKLAKERSRKYLAQIIMDADCAYDIVLLANSPTQAESLQLSMEWAAGGIGLHVNADKKYMRIN